MLPHAARAGLAAHCVAQAHARGRYRSRAASFRASPSSRVPARGNPGGEHHFGELLGLAADGPETQVGLSVGIAAMLGEIDFHACLSCQRAKGSALNGLGMGGCRRLGNALHAGQSPRILVGKVAMDARQAAVGLRLGFLKAGGEPHFEICAVLSRRHQVGRDRPRGSTSPSFRNRLSTASRDRPSCRAASARLAGTAPMARRRASSASVQCTRPPCPRSIMSGVQMARTRRKRLPGRLRPKPVRVPWRQLSRSFGDVTVEPQAVSEVQTEIVLMHINACEFPATPLCRERLDPQHFRSMRA